VAPSCLDGLRCAKGSRYEPASRLAITPKFITDYRWTFLDYGFAYVAACLSAQPPFRDAFLAAGASVYAGWERSVRVPYLCAAARDLFELMLGTNDLWGPDGAPLNTEPFLRPFAYGPVAAYLQKRGVIAYADPEDGAVSMAFAMNGARPLAFQTLRPSIFRMGVDEGNGELLLMGGQFGAAPGRVVVGPSVRQPTGTEVAPRADQPVEGGQELTVVSWASDGIRCKLPLTGPAASGYVQVWVDSRWSNVAQLTSWRWRLALSSSGPGTLQLRANLEVLVRADLRAVRTEVDGEPVHVPLVPFVAAKGLSASYSASGTHSGPSAGCDRTVGWDAAGALAPDLGPSTLLGFLDPRLRTLQFGVGLLVPSALRVTDTRVCSGTTTVTERLDTLALANRDTHAVVPAPPYIPVQLDEAYGIPAGAFEYVLDRLVISGGEVSTVRVQWDAAPASFPPELRNGGR